MSTPTSTAKNAGFWDERYRADAYVYGRQPNDFLRAEAHRIPPGPVLCLAEGEGRNAVFLATLGHQVTAVDFSAEGLRKTKLLAKEMNVEVTTVEADLAAYTMPSAAFSGIVAIFAHVPPAVRKALFARVPHALTPGGAFVLEAFAPQQLAFASGGPRDVGSLMALADLKTELSPLEIEIGREVEREINEGTHHTGMGATVQLVGRRASS